VVDDYAHHPAEIRATLQAARERGAARVVVVFQPHLPSRTRALGPQLAEALGDADVAIVTDVYLAREPPDPAVTGRDVAAAVPAPARAVYAPTLADSSSRWGRAT
jgi:UDP-N-acetylmuramate--alanine ligase